jgi:hypothetical protein
MVKRLGEKMEMPDVPNLELTGALSEIWFSINFAAYHLAFVRVYSQSAALRTNIEEMRKQEQKVRDNVQTDIVICRSHLADFFWHLEHVFEALRTAITRGQKEHPDVPYFWTYEKRLDVFEKMTIREEIKDYRNMGHQNPGVIGCKWDEQHNFVHHFLPTISGHEPKEDIDMNIRLQQYFEFAANVWFDFAPGDFKKTFPRDFKFPVTVPYEYVGELSEEIRSTPRLEVSIVSYSRERTDAETKKDVEETTITEVR